MYVCRTQICRFFSPFQVRTNLLQFCQSRSHRNLVCCSSGLTNFYNFPTILNVLLLPTMVFNGISLSIHNLILSVTQFKGHKVRLQIQFSSFVQIFLQIRRVKSSIPLKIYVSLGILRLAENCTFAFHFALSQFKTGFIFRKMFCKEFHLRNTQILSKSIFGQDFQGNSDT